MFNKFLIANLLFATMAVECYARPPTSTESSAAINPFYTPAPTIEAIQEMAKNLRKTHCSTPQCQAVQTLSKLLEIELDGMVTTNGIARPIPWNRNAVAARARYMTLFRHPARFRVICDTATSIIAKSLSSDVVPDHFVPFALLLTSLDMDERDHGHCHEALLQALPRTQSTDTMLEGVRNFCTYGRRYPKKLCDTVRYALLSH